MAQALSLVTYKNTAGDVADIVVAENTSGATFGAAAETNGTTLVTEQQTVQITAAPTATGLVTIAGVQPRFSLVRLRLRPLPRSRLLLLPLSPTNVTSVTVAGDTLTFTFNQAAGNAAAVTYAANGTGANRDRDRQLARLRCPCC